jgi:putative membrane protein
VPATTAAQRSSAAATIANPITVKQDAITQAQNYGAGLAPFFISLSAWIGIYALFLIVRPLSRRALTAVRRPIRTTLAGWVTPAAFGIVQMIALFSVLAFALHLQIANPVGLLAFMAFVSITFAAIVLALNVLLGSVGQFLGLILMIVQLVTAGGTFPWQTLPGPLAVLHQGLPMSHAVDGVRDLMYGAPASDLQSAILPLMVWLVAALAAATLGAARQGRFRTLRELRPSAIGG